MAIEIVSWPSLHERKCRTWGSNCSWVSIRPVRRLLNKFHNLSTEATNISDMSLFCGVGVNHLLDCQSLHSCRRRQSLWLRSLVRAQAGFYVHSFPVLLRRCLWESCYWRGINPGCFLWNRWSVNVCWVTDCWRNLSAVILMSWLHKARFMQPAHQYKYLAGCSLHFIFWSFEISVNILRNQKDMIGLDSYSRQISNYLDPILIYISLWIDCLFEIRKIAVCFLWLSLPGHYRVTDEALLAETT